MFFLNASPHRLRQVVCPLLVVGFLALLAGSHGLAVTPPGEGSLEADLLPACLIGLTWEQTPGYALVVEKASQTLSVYEWKRGFTRKHRFPCSTGEVSGKKERIGDRKTPEGVYFFTRAFDKRDLGPIYGNRAFVTDYPNFLDKKQSRDGHDIWLHGTNKPLKPRDSNGCIVMENRDIDLVAQYIQLNRTPIIIKEDVHMVPKAVCLAQYKDLTQFLSDWKQAFTSGDKAAFMARYETPGPATEALWRTWDEIRPAWKEAQLSVDMKLRNMAFARGNPCAVVLFEQAFELDNQVMGVGTMKLFLEQDKGPWKIVGEEYQAETSGSEAPHPMAASLARLDRLRKDFKTVAELITEWVDAWRTKDIERYRACYADDFYGQKMNLHAWIRHKASLNKMYKRIEVSIEDLEISEEQDRSTATFLQRYSSNRLDSVGIKRLSLRRVDGLWKIYRETWHKI
jgi:ketosteroid isomerase-like protein